MLKRTYPPMAIAGVALVSACIFSSCIEGADIAGWECASPDFGHFNADGNLDPCCIDKRTPCYDGEPSAPPACDGTCKPFGNAANWFPFPVFLWHGPSSGPIPDCPNTAMAPGLFGRDPVLPHTCPLCECGDPVCNLPDGLIADQAPGCQVGPFTDFHPEPDGSCSKKVSIDPNQLQSIAILPPTVSSCVASMVPVPRLVETTAWRTIALVCNGVGIGVCLDDPHNLACLPPAPPSGAGFTVCLQRNAEGNDDVPCPGEYPNKHVYYQGLDYRASCTPCECTSPIGSICTAEVTAYTSDSCTSDSAFVTATVTPAPGPPPCYNVQANTALRGLTERWLTNEPGKCDVIPSVPNGTVEPQRSTARQFCCADPDFPDPPDAKP
jgi:hypothetical protein